MLVTVDFETYYDDTLTLSRLTTSGYIRHPDFEVLMCAVKIDDGPTNVYVGPHVAPALCAIDWKNATFLSHNALFDAFILTQHYGCIPGRYADTLGMVRAKYPYWAYHRLGYMAEKLGLAEKIDGVLVKLKGKRIADLNEDEIAQAVEYCARDCDIAYGAYQLLKEGYPEAELDLIDLTIRLFAQPLLEVDVERADKALRAEILAKEVVLFAAGADKADLVSNEKFAAKLIELGVDPPRKVSPTTGKETWAFSKMDAGLKVLLEHEDSRVVNLVKARLRVKTALEETRAARFVSEGTDGTLPVGLRYYGAHTGRWSGANKLNLQNLPRGGELRKSIRAPKGHVIVVADLSQIECRMNAWLAGEQLLLQQFWNKEEIYGNFAGQFYGRAITKDKDPLERFVGKTCVLGLGYEMGPPKLQFSLANGKPPVMMELGECRRLVGLFRGMYPAIPAQWKAMQRILLEMARGKTGTYGPLEYGLWHMRLPNGMALQYFMLEERFGNLRYRNERGGVIDIYGGKATENVVQALSRIPMGDAMLRIDKELPIVMTTHDELAGVVPAHHAEDALKFMIEEMTRPLSWAPGLPLAAEGGFDEVYSK